jgi:hypothetical protein
MRIQSLHKVSVGKKQLTKRFKRKGGEKHTKYLYFAENKAIKEEVSHPIMNKRTLVHISC